LNFSNEQSISFNFSENIIRIRIINYLLELFFSRLYDMSEVPNESYRNITHFSKLFKQTHNKSLTALKVEH